MNVRPRAASFLCFFVVSSPGFSQQTAPPSPEGRHLTLQVAVTDSSGKPVHGLTEGDFSVFDNSRPLEITNWRPPTNPSSVRGNVPSKEPPIKVILVIDEVNSNFRRVAYQRLDLEKFLTQNGGRLAFPLSKVFYGNNGMEVRDSSSLDGKAWLAVLDQHLTPLRAVNKTGGLAGEVERFRFGINSLSFLATKQAQVPGRKIVIWISPGWPLLSDPRIDVSSKTENELFTLIVSLSTALRQAQISLYNVEHLDDSDGIRLLYLYREFLKPVTVPKQALPGNLALQVLAEQSGGLVINSSHGLDSMINQCIEDASATYSIAVDLPPADKPDDYHNLEVKPAKPGLTARTRKGYYVQP